MKRTKTEIQETETTTVKPKSRLFILCIQLEDGTIDEVIPGNNYDQLYLQGSTESKVRGGYWSTYDAQGRFIDGNYRSKVVTK